MGLGRIETVVLELPEADGPMINVEFALADIAASDRLVGLMAVPVGRTGVLVLLSGYGVEVELAETLSAVNDAVPFPMDAAVINEAVRIVPVGPGTEVTLASGKGTELPFIETTVAMDVLVVKETYVLVITDTDSTVPTLPTRAEIVPFEIGKGFGPDIEAAVAVSEGPDAKVALDKEKGAEVDSARPLVFLVLTGGPVPLVVDGVRVDSDMLVVIYGTEVVSCGMVVSAVASVEFPDGRGGNARLKLDPRIVDEEFPVAQDNVGDDSKVVRKEADPEAVTAAEPLVENVLISVILVESAAAVVNVMPAGVDGLAMTTSVEVEVVVTMASVVLTETRALVLSFFDEDVWW